MHGGKNLSNGKWFCHEFHVKNETSPGAKNGVAQWWVDAIPYLNFNNIDLQNSTGFGGFLLPSNHHYTTVDGKGRWQDIDDVAVSKDGRIGCLGSTPPPGRNSRADENLKAVP